MDFIGLTDHGSLSNSHAFYKACREAEVEPILGSEFYYVPDVAHRPAKGEKAERFHVSMLAKGAKGYQVLSELSTESHRNFYYKPLIGRKELEALGKDAEHLVVLSGCAGSIISQHIINDNIDAAEDELIWWRDNFPNFYIELMSHKSTFDKKLNAGLMKLARKYNIPPVITNDPHYALEEDCENHNVLLAISTGSDIDDPDRFQFDGEGYHLRSTKEIYQAFKEYGEKVWKPGILNTIKIAKECHTRIPAWDKRTWRLPTFPDVDDSFEELKRLTAKGLKSKGLHKDQRYVDRAKYELKIIKQMGIADFLLITLDFLEWARSKNIPIGRARGSIGGVLVAWLVGVQGVDPIRYGLLFERFISNEGIYNPIFPEVE